jgi:hypothetical protein
VKKYSPQIKEVKKLLQQFILNFVWITNGVGSNPTISDRGLRVCGVMVACKKSNFDSFYY